MGISRLFDIARRSMGVYQDAIYITSHNIANASNPAYSRQRVDLGTENPEINAGFVWGTGVKIEDISRVRHQFADAQIRSNNQVFYDNQQRSTILSQVESVFTEPSDLGLGNIMDEFFNSWNELSVTPNSSTLRDNVVQSAKKLSSKIQNITDDFNTLQSDVWNSFKDKIDDVNNHLKNIQMLNKQISESEAVGQNSNDLLDRRDQAIDELSQLVNINVTFDDQNSAMISIGGVYSVDKNYVTQFKADAEDGKLKMVNEDGAEVALSGGELGGLADVYGNQIPAYRDKLDTLVSALMDNVNSIHKKGYSLGNPPQTGNDFFTSYTDGKLEINSEILNDSNLISVSSDGTSGNGDIALQISEISNQKLINGATLTESYANLVSGIGTDKVSADNTMESTDLVLTQLEQEKSSVSGVSLDEEMTNLLTYQRSYDASAKLIKAADEMLQTVLDLVGQ
ncbi:MAG TPA: flagellar hook-associated protein FlgK [Ignavibacteriaceae bacterium]|jgi:flagellar hook-associated protein 1 FlgK|nr:flagellar hook-associated protein FlgK [Ignavibacteriaceae bacterium]